MGFAKKLGLYIVGSLLIEGAFYGIEVMTNNLRNGKTIFGKKIEPKKTTYVDHWQRIILGTNDYEVA